MKDGVSTPQDAPLWAGRSVDGDAAGRNVFPCANFFDFEEFNDNDNRR